jgi:23S rRNA pseudouridine1911/1915/1917 synthase
MAREALTILYEDNHLLAIAKPAGLLVQGDRTGDVTLLDLARAHLRDKYGKPGNVYLGLVHRLDRPVSGVVLLARTSKAAARLSAQFRAGGVEKVYLAVVEGVPSPGDAELVSWLADRADPAGRTAAATAPFPGAREARLRYRVREEAGGCALVEVRPATGRRHQIRVQLAGSGHPILGDVKYGARRFAPGRVALHAWRLTLAHPVGGAEVALEAPPPADWPWPPGRGGPRRRRDA